MNFELILNIFRLNFFFSTICQSFQFLLYVHLSINSKILESKLINLLFYVLILYFFNIFYFHLLQIKNSNLFISAICYFSLW